MILRFLTSATCYSDHIVLFYSEIDDTTGERRDREATLRTGAAAAAANQLLTWVLGRTRLKDPQMTLGTPEFTPPVPLDFNEL